MRSGYRIRVGKLEVRIGNRWSFSLRGDNQILELDAVDRVLSPELTAVIALFEDVIKRGRTLLCLLEPCYFKGSSPEVSMLYLRLRTLWDLCITVGAALCEYERTVPQFEIGRLSRNMSWVHKSLLQEAVEKAQQLGFPDAINRVGGFPAPTSQQGQVVGSWAKAMDKTHREDMNWVIWCLTQSNFHLQLKRFDE
jgi:hypothetical protein